MRVKLLFAWFDFWVGLFWDRKAKRLYVFPIPMFGFYVQFLLFKKHQPYCHFNNCVLPNDSNHFHMCNCTAIVK